MKSLITRLIGTDSTIKTKAQSNLRWLVLFSSCLVMIGNYYCYDNPAALHTQLQQYLNKPTNYETLFSLLYTVYRFLHIVIHHHHHHKHHHKQHHHH